MFLRRLVSNLLGAVYDAVWPPEEAPWVSWEERTVPPRPPEPAETGAPLREHIESGAIDLESFDSLTRGAASGWEVRGPRVDLTDEDWEKLRDVRWDHVLVAFHPRPDPGALVHTIEQGHILVDAGGAPVARVKEGPIQIGLGCRSFIAVEWLADDYMARRAARLELAPWIRAGGPSEEEIGEWVEDAIRGQIDLDEKNGLLRPGFAAILRERFAKGMECAEFFSEYIARSRR